MPISSILINFLLFMLLARFLWRFPTMMKGLRVIIVLATGISLIWLVVTALAYLYTPLFFDHAEASIASVGAYWAHGNPIYTELTDPRRYSLLYGPVPYIVTGFFHLMGPESIVLAKLPGILSLAVMLLSAWVLARKLQTSSTNKFLAVAAVAAVLTGFYNYSYWIRPDSFLTTFVFLAFVLVSSQNLSSWWVYIFVPILAGLSVNCKAYAVLYFIPLAVFYVESQPKKFSIGKLTLAVAVFVISVAIPFLLKGVSLKLFIEWLELASRHGLLMALFFKNATLVTAFFVLLAILGFYRRYKWSFLTMCLCALVVSLAGSKNGAGTNHLMPFLPVMLWMSLNLYFEASQEDRKRLSYVAGAFLLTLNLNAFNRQKRVVQLFSETTQRREEFADLKMLAKKYPQAELGFTSLESYLTGSYRPWLIARGGSLTWDGSSLMDLGVSGILLSSEAIDFLSSCRVPYFIFPSQGRPWELTSLYDSERLFSVDFERAFLKNYRVLESTKYFIVYGCLNK